MKSRLNAINEIDGGKYFFLCSLLGLYNFFTGIKKNNDK